MTIRNENLNALAPLPQNPLSKMGGQGSASPEMKRFLSLDMEQQMQLIGAVAKFSNDHCLFIVGPDRPSRLMVDGVVANRELQPFRVGNAKDPSTVDRAAKWWTWTDEVRLKVHYLTWFEDRDQAITVHGLVNIALDGEGFPISSDLHAWHDVPLAKLIEVIERCARLHEARTRTNEQRMQELQMWAAVQLDEAMKAQALGGSS